MMMAAMLSPHAWLAMLCMQVIAVDERESRQPPVAASTLALLGGSALSVMVAL
jgi:hypothetical protein